MVDSSDNALWRMILRADIPKPDAKEKDKPIDPCKVVLVNWREFAEYVDKGYVPVAGTAYKQEADK